MKLFIYGIFLLIISCQTTISDKNIVNLSTRIFKNGSEKNIDNNEPITPGNYDLLIYPILENGDIIKNPKIDEFTIDSLNNLIQVYKFGSWGFKLVANTPTLLQFLDNVKYQIRIGVLKNNYNKTLTMPIARNLYILSQINLKGDNGKDGNSGVDSANDLQVILPTRGQNGQNGKSVELYAAFLNVSDIFPSVNENERFIVILDYSDNSEQVYYGFLNLNPEKNYTKLDNASIFHRVTIDSSGGNGGNGGNGNKKSKGGSGGDGGNGGDINLYIINSETENIFNLVSNGGNGGKSGNDEINDNFLSQVLKSLPSGFNGKSGKTMTHFISLEEMKKIFRILIDNSISERIIK